MAIVIPDLFGAFQKGREYAIDRNWKDLTNYEAIEKARNENDLGALNLLERRVMFAPKMSMYKDNADMSARNNALGGAAFSGLMAKTQAQSAYDTAKAGVDMKILPEAINTYETTTRTSLGTANTESAIQNATNDENMKNAKTLGELAAQTRLNEAKFGAENARQAYDNAVKMNALFQENYKVALREAKFKNSQKGLEIEQMMQQGRWYEAKQALLQLGINVEDTAYQAKKSPEQRAEENNPTTEAKPTLSPEQINYALERIQTGTNTVGQPLTAGELNYYTAILNTEAAANYIKTVFSGNPTFYTDTMTRAGNLLGGALTNNNSGSNKVLVPQNPNNAGNNSAGNNSAGNNPAANTGNNPPVVNTDPNFVDLFGRRIPTSEIDKYIIGQEQLGQVLLNRPVGTTANGIPYYIGGKTAVSPTQWYIGNANTQPFQLTNDDWTRMQQVGTVPVLLTLPNNRFQQVLINPDLAQRAGIQDYQVLTIDKLNALLQAQGQ